VDCSDLNKLWGWTLCIRMSTHSFIIYMVYLEITLALDEELSLSHCFQFHSWRAECGDVQFCSVICMILQHQRNRRQHPRWCWDQRDPRADVQQPGPCSCSVCAQLPLWFLPRCQAELTTAASDSWTKAFFEWFLYCMWLQNFGFLFRQDL
jgi:hypothetical protein